ncbi:hypothetical protein ACQKGO_34905 [Corallococcus interemptor]|uniref:hypothetical protein n=1 Tax=Corallococcus interemptor TaxID=2316720 RepID=UPI003D000603
MKDTNEDTSNTQHPPAMDSGTESTLLREIHHELRRLREAVGVIQARITQAAPIQAARAVTVDAARALLGCGRSQVFALLKAGALSRAPKVGKTAMVTMESIEALQERFGREPTPKLKRQPARSTATGRETREAILRLLRQP